MRRLVFLLLVAVTVCSCSGAGNGKEKTSDEKVADLLRAYFEKQALDCSVASVHAIDTLYEPMPKDDPVYVELMHKGDSASAAEIAAVMEDIRAGRITGPMDPHNNSYRFFEEARNYRAQYKGAIESYVYRCIVKSSSYELKKDVEGRLYLVDSAYTKVAPVPKEYIEVRELSSLY